MSLTLEQFRAVNLQRARRWHHGSLDNWSVSDWAVAMMGEAGEVCDAIKKLRRIEEGMASKNRTQPTDIESAKLAIAKEIGDTFTYLDLLAQRQGLRLEDCVRLAFNSVSEREGFPERV